MKRILFLMTLTTLLACNGKSRKNDSAGSDSTKTSKVEMGQFKSLIFWKSPVAADRAPAEFSQIVREGDSLKFYQGQKFRFISKSDGKYITKTDTLIRLTLKNEVERELLDSLSKWNFPALNSRYQDPDILDGDVWNIQLETSLHQKKVLALNKFPPEVRALSRLIRKIQKNH